MRERRGEEGKKGRRNGEREEGRKGEIEKRGKEVGGRNEGGKEGKTSDSPL